MWQGILNIFYDLDKSQIVNKIKSYYNNTNNIKQESIKHNYVNLPETQTYLASQRPFSPFDSGLQAAAASAAKKQTTQHNAEHFFDKTKEASEKLIGRANESSIFSMTLEASLDWEPHSAVVARGKPIETGYKKKGHSKSRLAANINTYTSNTQNTATKNKKQQVCL